MGFDDTTFRPGDTDNNILRKILQALSGGSPGLGTVTSVGLSAPSLFTVSGSPVTGAGTLTLTYGAGTLPVANGGTNIASYSVGDLLYASAAGVLSKLADVAAGNALISGGVSTAPIYGKIGLTTHVSGTLAVGNGGTGTGTAFTANSVVFAGASGVYSQDNTNFNWDATNAILNVKNLSILQSSLTFAATTNIDFNAGGTRTISLTGNVTFTTSNRAANKSVTLKILCDGTARNFTFPAWIFVGSAAPASIAINKTAILSLTCFGANDTDIVAAYAAQP